MKKNYQLGLLHFVHMLINTDGKIDDREMEIILKIKNEEDIDDTVFLEFSRSIALLKGQQIFNRGLDLLNDCTEEEKICAFVYLFQLAEADATISMKEVRLLMYALKVTNVDFNDVAISTDLVTPNANRLHPLHSGKI
ncbi:MAG TPA: hypothetical protein PLJ60_17020 [Chryseolinea sp.]|nr:hypothetical protein [Chryseolinea sp.]HPM32037.1 hypothetical protein [Chryseolinea sp.]